MYALSASHMLKETLALVMKLAQLLYHHGRPARCARAADRRRARGFPQFRRLQNAAENSVNESAPLSDAHRSHEAYIYIHQTRFEVVVNGGCSRKAGESGPRHADKASVDTGCIRRAIHRTRLPPLVQ